MVRTVADHLLQQAADDGAEGLGHEPRQQHLLHQGQDVGVADPGQAEVQHGRGLVDDAPGVRLDPDPGSDPAAEVGCCHPLAEDRLLQEVLPDELLETAAELVLAARDECGVRDGETERVLEQRGDREPVGQRADHTCLGGGADVAHPRRGAVRLRP